MTENVGRENYNLVRFSAADADAVSGRTLTEGELRALVKTLEFSSMGEVFSECVELVAEDVESE